MYKSIKTIIFCALATGYLPVISLPLTPDESPHIRSFSPYEQQNIAYSHPAERPIVVIVCSYNNAEWSVKNLNSIFLQNYSNLRVIIVDDCSSDNNAQVIQDYVDKYNLAHRVTFIRNEQRTRKMYNLYKILYMCRDDEIVIMVDGDDWFRPDNPEIFQFYNQLYANQDIWFTYGQYRNEPAEEAIKWGFKEIGYCREVPKKIKETRTYRKYSFVYMHPRSFRAWLFKSVKLEDLIAETVPGFEGDYYPAANDNAMCFPMIEMAHTHIKFIPDVLYVRNLYNEIVGFKVDKTLQVASSREIRKKPRYAPLNKPRMRDADLAQYASAQADLFIVCKDGLGNIETILNNVQDQLSNIKTIYVFYQGTETNKEKVRSIKKEGAVIEYIPFYQSTDLSLKNRLIECIHQSSQAHVILTTNAFKILTPLNISSLIYWLERTQAHRFYLNRHTHHATVPRFVMLNDTICAWKFLIGKDIWRGISTLTDVVLYNKTTLLNDIHRIAFTNTDELDKEFSAMQAPLSKIALFFKDEKISEQL